MLVAKRKNNKRIQSTLTSSIPSASVVPDKIVTNGPSAGASVPRSFVPDAKTSSLDVSRSHSHSLSPLQTESIFRSSAMDLRSFETNPFAGDDYGMDMDVPISSLDKNGSASGNGKGKRKSSAIDMVEEARTSKPRTLGGDLTKSSIPIREIEAGKLVGASSSRFWGEPQVTVLPQPPLLTYLSAKLDGGDDVLEARNPENSGRLFLVSPPDLSLPFS